MFWTPDFCPSESCRLEVSTDWAKATFLRSCPHHDAMRARLGDDAVFNVILTSSRIKEAARWAAKLELALPENHPGVPYRVDPDGGFTVGVDQRGVRMPEWPNGVRKTTLVAVIDAAVALVLKTADTSVVRIA